MRIQDYANQAGKVESPAVGTSEANEARRTQLEREIPPLFANFVAGRGEPARQRDPGGDNTTYYTAIALGLYRHNGALWPAYVQPVEIYEGHNSSPSRYALHFAVRCRPANVTNPALFVGGEEGDSDLLVSTFDPVDHTLGELEQFADLLAQAHERSLTQNAGRIALARQWQSRQPQPLNFAGVRMVPEQTSLAD